MKRTRMMKQEWILKKIILLLLMLGITLESCVLFAQAAETGDYSNEVGVQQLGVSYNWTEDEHGGALSSASKEIKPASGQISVNVSSYRLSSYTYTAGNLELIFTNNYESDAYLSFDWTITNGYGSFTIAGDGPNGSKTGSVSKKLASRQSVKVTITSNNKPNSASQGAGMDITNIKLVEDVKQVTVTFLEPEIGGSYTVDEESITSTTSKTSPSNHVYELKAKADKGYVFAGWKNEKNEYYSTEESWRKAFSDNVSVCPVFVSEESAQFGVGDQKFFNLNAANAYAESSSDKTIVLLKGGTLPAEDYTISSGVTLYIPYDNSTTINRSSTVDKKYDGNTSYPCLVSGDKPTAGKANRTLTIPNKVTLNVNGTVYVDGQVLANTARPTGDYGLITLESGSQISLNDGAKLYCWGYINGDGTVTAHDNSSVYECFQLEGWRGGGVSLNIKNNDQHVFPVNQFYIQNVEARLELEYGASEYVFAGVTVNVKVATAYASTIEKYIGKDGGMFQPQSGCTLVKKYVPATDRTVFEVRGDMHIGTMGLTLVPHYKGIFGIVDVDAFTVNLQTGNFVLPINGAFSVNIYSGTTTIIKDQDLCLLPGAEFTVSKGAKFVAQSNMYVYDRSEWIDQKYAYGFGTTGSSDFAPVYYSTANGTTHVRTSADLKDATVDVNGTMEISGHIYTTASGANIFSTEGTGQVKFSTAAGTEQVKTYQYQNNSTFVDIACDPAQLRNGNGTYTQTAGAQAGWTYKYDTVAQKWYRFRVKYQFNGKDIGEDLITTSTSTWDVSFATDSLEAEIISGKGEKTTATVADGVLTVSDVVSDCVVNIKGVAASYTPYFVLNEKQYGIYLSYGGTAITNTTKIGEKTYYVVEACGTLEFGKALDAPENASMGVIDNEANGITWFLEDTTTGAQVFMNTVPKGKTQGGPVYIYGIYSGYVVQNTDTGKYYTNLADAVEELPTTPNGQATLKMLANCGTFEDESKTASYSFIANITFDLNGKEVWGSLVNNGTLTLMDSAGGGKIISATTSTTNNPASFAYAIRNNGTLSMENITVVGGSQTNNDYFVGVLNVTTASQQDVSTIDSIKNCTINVTNGYGIYNYSGTINTIEGGSITAKYGIYNRNLRTQGVSSGVSPVIKATAIIGTIQDTIVTVTQQYALWNGGKINTICGNSKFLNTGTSNYIVYNSNQWFYDYYITSRKDDTSNGYVRTDERKEDDTIIPTIGTITDNVEISSSTCSYGLANYGNIGSIEGNVKIFANSNALAVLDGGKIDSINGNGETGITIEATATERGISISGQKTMQQKTTYSDKIGGTVTSIETTYYEDRPSSIGTITGKVTISAKSNYGIINYGVIDSITGADVTIQANRYALYNTEGGRVLTEKQTRTNLGQVDEASAGYLTLYEYERTYHKQGPYIGTIAGITVKCTEYTGLTNHGTIDTIKDVNATATYNAICNVNGHFTERKSFSLWHGASAWATSPNYAWDVAISYTRLQPTIGSITGTTATTTSAYGALVNTGVIETIDGCTLTANTYNALSNSLCGTGYYLGNKASTYVEYKQFILLEGSKYVFRPLDSTTSYTRGEIRTITNTKITAKKVSDWCAALDNNGKIGTIGAGTVVNVESAATTNNKDRTYGIRVSGDCYVTRRDVYKNVTETIKALGTPTSGQYYRQDEFYNTYDDNIYAEIGSISGVTVTNPYGYGILNSGIIENINSGTSVSSYRGAIFNSDGRYVGTKNSVQLRSGTTAYATTTSVVSESNYLYSRLPAEITLIDGVKLEATGTYYGVYNRGHIGTIKKSTIAAAESYAIRNEDKTYLTYEVKATGNSVEGLNAYLAWDGTKYVFVTAVASTKTYDATCQPAVIDLIGEGNTLTAKANTIYNAGTIKQIDGGTVKTSVTATGGLGIYNYRGAYLSESFVAGKATYTYQSASIGTIANTVVSATAQALVNGDGNSAYPAVKINGLGEGNVFTSQNSNGVTNNTYASIGAISGGIYTAGGSGCGLQNNNASAAIDISATTESGPYFKGGTSDRAHAISDPDNTARQTYPTGYTLSGVTRSVTVNGTAADGYYFVTKNEFTIVFDGNPATVSGSVASMTVSRTATSVTLPGSGFTCEGFEQVGWALTADTGADSDKLLKPGAKVTLAQLGNPAAGAEVPLYAVWKPTKTYNITVTWNGNLSYTYNPAVYRWDGATMKYLLDSPAYWYSTLGKDQWPSVTVKNAGTDKTKEGTVAVTIAYTSATNYDALNMNFTVNGITKTGSATLSGKLTLGDSASATMELTGTPPNETATNRIVGSVKLTLTPTDG